MTKSRVFVILMFVVLFATFAIGLTTVETPEEYSGTMETTGNIVKCVTKELSGSKFKPTKYFLGLYIDDANVPYIRTNPKVEERDYYNNLCATNATVTIKYTATKKLVGDINYWAESIYVKEHNN